VDEATARCLSGSSIPMMTLVNSPATAGTMVVWLRRRSEGAFFFMELFVAFHLIHDIGHVDMG